MFHSKFSHAIARHKKSRSTSSLSIPQRPTSGIQPLLLSDCAPSDPNTSSLDFRAPSVHPSISPHCHLHTVFHSPHRLFFPALPSLQWHSGITPTHFYNALEPKACGKVYFIVHSLMRGTMVSLWHYTGLSGKRLDGANWEVDMLTGSLLWFVSTASLSGHTKSAVH